MAGQVEHRMAVGAAEPVGQPSALLEPIGAIRRARLVEQQARRDRLAAESGALPVDREPRLAAAVPVLQGDRSQPGGQVDRPRSRRPRAHRQDDATGDAERDRAVGPGVEPVRARATGSGSSRPIGRRTRRPGRAGRARRPPSRPSKSGTTRTAAGRPAPAAENDATSPGAGASGSSSGGATAAIAGGAINSQPDPGGEATAGGRDRVSWAGLLGRGRRRVGSRGRDALRTRGRRAPAGLPA